jgi:hypothetical protein
MQHLPIALLLAFCALFAVASAATCNVRFESFLGTNSCNSDASSARACVFQSRNDTGCFGLTTGNHSYRVNCTTQTAELFDNNSCSDVASQTVANKGCVELSSTTSLSFTFDSECSSAAAVQSWISYFLF